MAGESAKHGCEGCAQRGHLCTSRISLFAGLDEEAQVNLVRLAQHRDFRRGETVFRSEDRADSFLILRFGRIKLSRLTPDGKEFVLDILSPGDVLGAETSAPFGRCSEASAQ